jgi:integrase
MTATRAATVETGDHSVPGVTGLLLRVRSNARGESRTWHYRFKLRGVTVKMALGSFPAMQPADARRRVDELAALLDRGIDPRRATPARPRSAGSVADDLSDPHTVEFLAHEFVERFIKVRRKRPEAVVAMLEKDVLPLWRKRDARTIKPREVIELLDGIVGRGSPVAANRLANILGQMFKFGVHRAIVDTTPVQLLYRPGGTERPRERCLSDAELRAFLEDPVAATRYERLAHVITLLLLTGQRRGELCGALWADVDLRAATWRIPDEASKTGKGHTVPLSPWAVDEFRALKRLARRSRFVIPSADDTKPLEAKLLTRGVAKCLRRFEARGIAPFTLHDLRRTCRTGLARLQVAPHIAERVLNHAQDRIPGTYDVHDYVEEKREALVLWERHLSSLKEPN